MERTSLDRTVAILRDRKHSWAATPVEEKIELLGDIRIRIGRVARAWVEAAAGAKGLSIDSPLAGEEWTSGPYAVASGLNALEDTLRRIASGTDILSGFPVRTRADGRVVVDVFPADMLDRVFLSGHRAEVWMKPGITSDRLAGTLAAFYRDPDPTGAVTLVLGAGNISSIAPLDVLYRMYVHGDVVIVKLSPVNDYLAPFIAEVFAPLTDRGWVRIVTGGAGVGEYLAHHEGVDRAHITGAARTHDAITFGGGADAAERKRASDPLLTKPITSELGGVGPTIVVPGPWRDADVAHQAEHIVTQKLHNGGFNCISCQVLVLPKGWSRSTDLVDAIHGLIRRLPGRPAYYPGTERRVAEALSSHPAGSSIEYGGETVAVLDVDAEASDEACFTRELFAPVIGITALPGDTPAEFLGHAVRFANERLAGTLGANILIDPATAKRHAEVLDAAVADLRYGTIAINTWTGVAFAMPRAPWGAFPGSTIGDIQSGSGVVHNALMFGQPERTVVRGAFAPFPRSLVRGELHVEPKPPTFVTNRQAATVGQRLTRQAISRAWTDVPGIITAALRG